MATQPNIPTNILAETQNYIVWTADEPDGETTFNVELGTVPRALDHASFERPLGHRPAVVGAHIIDRVVAVVEVKDRDRLIVQPDDLAPALRNLPHPGHRDEPASHHAHLPSSSSPGHWWMP